MHTESIFKEYKSQLIDILNGVPYKGGKAPLTAPQRGAAITALNKRTLARYLLNRIGEILIEQDLMDDVSPRAVAYICKRLLGRSVSQPEVTAMYRRVGRTTAERSKMFLKSMSVDAYLGEDNVRLLRKEIKDLRSQIQQYYEAIRTNQKERT